VFVLRGRTVLVSGLKGVDGGEQKKKEGVRKGGGLTRRGERRGRRGEGQRVSEDGRAGLHLPPVPLQVEIAGTDTDKWFSLA
jgi:hypothetical protein